MIRQRSDVSPDCERFQIPDYMQKGIERYLFDRIEPGGFLTALLQNDFMKAANKADATNLFLLGQWAAFFFDCLPSNAYGSPKVVAAWLNDTKGGA